MRKKIIVSRFPPVLHSGVFTLASNPVKMTGKWNQLQNIIIMTY